MSDNDATSPALYQLNQGWNRKSVLPLLISIGFVSATILTWNGTVLDWFACLFFGGCGIAILIAILRRSLGVRVDVEGITLGSSPLRRDVPDRLVPWSDVETIVLYEQSIPSTVKQTTTYIGVRRRPGLAPLPGSPGPRALRASEMLIPGIPREVLETSVPVNGWRLDEERFVRALGYNAPQVQVEVRSG